MTYYFIETTDGFTLERGDEWMGDPKAFFYKRDGWTREWMDKLVVALNYGGAA